VKDDTSCGGPGGGDTLWRWKMMVEHAVEESRNALGLEWENETRKEKMAKTRYNINVTSTKSILISY